MFYNEHPYTDNGQLNLDWVIKNIKHCLETVDNFVITGTLKFADPILWDSQKTYDKNTIVVDAAGNGYVSKEATPIGIALDNTEYWQQISNFNAQLQSVLNELQTTNANVTSNTSAISDINADIISLENYVTPQMFGAVGDGITNDTQAFTDMFNQDKNVYIPNGVYLIEGGISCTKPISIIGQSISNTVIKFKDGSVPADTFKMFNCTNTNGLTIKNIKIDNGEQVTDSYTVDFLGSTNLIVENVEIQNSYGYAMRINNINHAKFENLHVHDVTGTDGNPGGAIFGSNFKNVSFHNITGRNLDDHLIYITGTSDEGSHDITISDCKAENTGRGSLTAGASIVLYGRTHTVSISNCTISNSKNGIDIKDYHEPNMVPYDVAISNITMTNIKQNGLSMVCDVTGDITDITVSNIIINAAGQDGIALKHVKNLCIDDVVMQAIKRDAFNLRFTSYGMITNVYVYDMASALILGPDNNTCNSLTFSNMTFNRCTANGVFDVSSALCTMSNTWVLNLKGSAQSTIKTLTLHNCFISGTFPKSVMYNAGTNLTNVSGVKGNIVLNTNPSSGSPIGWVCVADGIPGTWKAFGTIS